MTAGLDRLIVAARNNEDWKRTIDSSIDAAADTGKSRNALADRLLGEA